MSNYLFLLSITYLIFFNSLNPYAQDFYDWKSKYCGYFSFSKRSKNVHTNEVRLWVGHKQVMRILADDNDCQVYMYSYIDVVDSNGIPKRVIFKREKIGFQSSNTRDSISILLHTLRNVHTSNEYVSADYEFELLHGKSYASALIDKSSIGNRRVTSLISWLLNDFAADYRYQDFMSTLPPGYYFNGKVIIGKNK
jgi:hypothetical protein